LVFNVATPLRVCNGPEQRFPNGLRLHHQFDIAQMVNDLLTPGAPACRGHHAGQLRDSCVKLNNNNDAVNL